MVPGLVGLTDVSAVIIVSFVVHGIRFGWQNAGDSAYFAASVLMALFVACAFRSGGLYDFETIAAWPRRSGRLVVRVVAVAFLLTGLAFAFKISDQFSRIWLSATTVVSMVLIWGLRGMAAALIRHALRSNKLIRSVAVIGANLQAERLLTRLVSGEAKWTRVAGIFDDRKTRVAAEMAGVPVMGTVEDLITAVRRGEVDDVVIALPWNAEDRLTSLIDRLRALPIDVYLGADMINYRYVATPRVYAGGVSVLDVARKPLSGWKGILKALEDRSLAALAFLAFGPLMALVAVAIKLDSPGPVLFRQKRYGFNNEPIEVFKFRTMRHDRPDGDVFVQATKTDPRVTRIGRFLRRTSLDELPQLFNVLNGTMSMVGPRPHPVELNEEFARLLSGYYGRNKVKPGITGWAQINGLRGETDTLEKMRARVEHDILYVESWSLWLDVRILFVTLFRGWVHKNAY